jgi:hypothetical protein
MTPTVPTAELDAWNAAIIRSRREYEETPTAACRVPSCFELPRTAGGYCQSCATLNGMAAARMRRLSGAA